MLKVASINDATTERVCKVLKPPFLSLDFAGGGIAIFQFRWDAGFAEIFLRQDVTRDLAPGRRRFHAVEFENDRAIRIPDFTCGLSEFYISIR
jgi:hypothetical protein